ncbi:DUF4160 domain-containing protein [Aequorivita sp. H23M31]|uniref:DUF4160 domain-containing protein n=1 Tax=Aequorivita ciconiae TaxID=2494375 RepID=A0A410G387_9FLAO|nr:DUF4160 domain-containing protein [Aequorivita sp. H23M31]QAA81701.1 DUF4160 domain-containing protein [Aequorivita sp. H23M31]
MPEISRFYGIIIRMYFVDHNPPHFHAEYQGMQAEFEIKTLEVIAGSLPNRALGLVVEWANLHRKELLENWNRAQVPEPLEKIQPLK